MSGVVSDPTGDVDSLLRADVVAAGREALGFDRTAHRSTDLREALRAGSGWYPVVALGVLAVVDQLQGYGYFIFAPEISRALGVGKTVIGGLALLKIVALTAAALPTAALVHRIGRRGLIAILTAAAWSVATFASGFVVLPVALAFVLLIDGATSGSVQAIHRPLLVDSYPPQARVRVLSLYRAADQLGQILPPLLIALLVGVWSFTWRGVFVVMGIVSALAVVASSRLRDPGVGRFDEARLEAGGKPDDNKDSSELGFYESAHRLMLIPTVRRVLVGSAALGVMLTPLLTYLFFFLDQRFGLGPSGRALFFSVVPIAAVTALSILGRRGDEMFRTNPSKLLDVAAVLIVGGASLVAISIAMPWLVPCGIVMALGFACFALTYPAQEAVLFSVVPAPLRPHVAALSGIFMAAVGGVLGLVLLGSIDRRFGTSGAIVSVLVPAAIAGIIFHNARKGVEADIDRLVKDLTEGIKIRELDRDGVTPPLLACRGIDFSYGNVQVLFGVDFTVRDGEMIALLGTNGAGKSTLLRAISGLGLPTSGTIRLNGRDITHFEAERRVGLGVVQVPGGQGVFGPVSVADTLRAYGHSVSAGRRHVDSAIDSALEAFPQLANRRNQLAQTLSGGEQQMLALAKVWILRPRLLLIDELSLGLAPRIVAELMTMVTNINRSGTAVVLVEQSVNVALNLADHAYFMEKGEIRFDGSAHELRGRDDLLRAVFLHQHAKAPV